MAPFISILSSLTHSAVLWTKIYSSLLHRFHFPNIPTPQFDFQTFFFFTYISPLCYSIFLMLLLLLFFHFICSFCPARWKMRFLGKHLRKSRFALTRSWLWNHGNMTTKPSINFHISCSEEGSGNNTGWPAVESSDWLWDGDFKHLRWPRVWEA